MFIHIYNNSSEILLLIHWRRPVFVFCVGISLAQFIFCIFCMGIVQGPTYWIWIWKRWGIQTVLNQWVLSTIVLDPDRTLSWCHVRQNLLFFAKPIVITMVTWSYFGSKKFFKDFRCNIILNFDHLSHWSM